MKLGLSHLIRITVWDLTCLILRFLHAWSEKTHQLPLFNYRQLPTGKYIGSAARHLCRREVTEKQEDRSKAPSRPRADREVTSMTHKAHLFHLFLAIGQYSGDIFEFCIATDIWLNEQINQWATRKHELERSRCEKLMITFYISEKTGGHTADSRWRCRSHTYTLVVLLCLQFSPLTPGRCWTSVLPSTADCSWSSFWVVLIGCEAYYLLAPPPVRWKPAFLEGIKLN